MRQLSLFAAGEQQPAVADLEGLLAGPGRIVRREDSARISVVLGDAWRAGPLLAAFAERRLAGEDAETVDRQPVVRTAFAPVLLPVAQRWLRGSAQIPPDGFSLDGARLRLWVLAAGRPDPYGFLLLLGGADERVWQLLGASLQLAGLPGTLLGPRAGGPAYRITGRKRLGRLRELVGDPPDDTDPAGWPGAQSAHTPRYV